eukprot:TRINITY_DN11431_c0_g1_i2.p2 TRINITY_DN11431_c0_g1~~TRINITY_DN11431_c0_g1_i2.p2  ORF type:complete len:115 (+),score=16.44 TRINITY_DN11431_c0_g1_i2:237-581(+)
MGLEHNETELQDTESLLPSSNTPFEPFRTVSSGRRAGEPVTPQCLAIRGALHNELIEPSPSEGSPEHVELIRNGRLEMIGALNNDDFCLMLLSMWIGTAIVIFIYWIVFMIEEK